MTAAAAVLLGIAALSATAGPAVAGATDKSIRIATWNLEWLISPQAFKSLKAHCVPRNVRPPRGEREIPCDVSFRLERSSRDFAVLARYARELDADVIALQETDGPDAARLVFPGYAFCFTTREHVQNNGFAVRPGIAFRCGRDIRDLSLGDALRRGKELTLFPDEPREIRLVSVHLKSGCASKPLTSPDSACTELARQAPALRAWIDAEARAGRRFAVLGDFNRDLLSETAGTATPGVPESFSARIDGGNPTRLRNVAEGEPFRNCVPGQGHRSYIDNILLSPQLAANEVAGSFGRVTYSAVDARHARLSDHCPVSIRLRIQ